VKKIVISCCCVVGALCVIELFWYVDDTIAPLFLNSKIERIKETGLPKAFVENGEIYFRMKADDFRLPLPPNSRLMPPTITAGGFDTVNGSVEVRFETTNQTPALVYENWLSTRLPAGASVSAKDIPGGIFIDFRYFGDK
jgi:hypothetical protein